MRDPANVLNVARLSPDYLGFVFANDSPRYVNPNSFSLWRLIENFPSIRFTGVFVNEALDSLVETAAKGKFKAIQLHGSESPEYCELVRKSFPKVEIMKTFEIEEHSNIEELTKFHLNVVDYFLFDSPRPKSDALQKSQIPLSAIFRYSVKPYFLAGRLDLSLAKEASCVLKNTSLIGFDFSSKLELSPGQKCEAKCLQTIQAIAALVA